MHDRIRDPNFSLPESIDDPDIEYLYKTVIYVWRENETGIPMPEDIGLGRLQAWASLQNKGKL